MGRDGLFDGIEVGEHGIPLCEPRSRGNCHVKCRAAPVRQTAQVVAESGQITRQPDIDTGRQPHGCRLGLHRRLVLQQGVVVGLGDGGLGRAELGAGGHALNGGGHPGDRVSNRVYCDLGGINKGLGLGGDGVQKRLSGGINQCKTSPKGSPRNGNIAARDDIPTGQGA